MARAALRVLQRCPSLRESWPAAPFHELLFHSDADVRWAAVECVALLSGLVGVHPASLAWLAQ